MASLVKWLFFAGARDVAGTAVASGKAYFYQYGTSSELTVYKNDTASESWTQPITLDAAGRAEVYITAPAEVRIKTAAGASVTLSTRGESYPAGAVDCTWDSTAHELDAVLTHLESALGTGALYKESSESGVVTRTYQAVLRQFISPYDFGAAGNGTSDDTTKLQAAINRAVATGLPLNLEVGTYKFAGTLTAAGNIRIYGAGCDKAILLRSTTGATGLSVVAATSYLRDFAIHLPYAGDTYDKAVSIAGSTCTCERLDVTGGQGIYSTAPFTRVVDCVVAFKCPNTVGAYGSGIYVQTNSIVENCNVDGQVGNSSSYLTRGIYFYSSSETTCKATGGKVTNCYVGGEGGLFDRVEFDTCTTAVKATGPRHGATNCVYTSCTNGLVVSGGVYAVNVANHDDADPYYDSSCHHESSDSATPTFTVHSECDTNVFRCTYDGNAAISIDIDSDLAWKIGRTTRIIIQTSGDAAITGFTWGTDMSKIQDPTGTSELAMCSVWMWSGAGKLVQIRDWEELSGDFFT
jgi:hypothetical protein